MFIPLWTLFLSPHLFYIIATTTEWDMSQAALQVTSGHANRASCPSGHELRKSEAGRFSVFFVINHMSFTLPLWFFWDKSKIAARYLKNIKRGLPVSPNHFGLLVYMLYMIVIDCYCSFTLLQKSLKSNYPPGN